LLLYQIVCTAKYRAGVFNLEVKETLKVTCEFISSVYEIFIAEIGTDYDHVLFLVQSVPMLSPTKIVTTIKSLTAKAILQPPRIKEKTSRG
jgi:putative transposase